MNILIARASVVFSLIFAPMSAMAENELLGTVVGTFNDDSRDFYSIVAWGESTSSFFKSATSTHVTVEAYANRETPFSSAVITIRFSIRGNVSESGAQAFDAEINYRPEAQMFPFYSGEGDAVELLISNISYKGESVFVTAEFTARLGLNEGSSKKTADEIMLASGSFKVEARKQ